MLHVCSSLDHLISSTFEIFFLYFWDIPRVCREWMGIVLIDTGTELPAPHTRPTPRDLGCMEITHIATVSDSLTALTANSSIPLLR